MPSTKNRVWPIRVTYQMFAIILMRLRISLSKYNTTKGNHWIVMIIVQLQMQSIHWVIKKKKRKQQGIIMQQDGSECKTCEDGLNSRCWKGSRGGRGAEGKWGWAKKADFVRTSLFQILKGIGHPQSLARVGRPLKEDLVLRPHAYPVGSSNQVNSGAYLW